MINSAKFIELRKSKKMTREYLAVELSISTSAIWNAENDPHHNSSINLILKYIKYFKVEFEELVNTDEVKLGATS